MANIKKFIRILIGLPLSFILIGVSTWIWFFSDQGNWIQDVAKPAWCLASGNWDKLPK
jgi:hypothetical protein